jgi:8-oxo-dGTP pyrophosphatase MutT (NUDIX family)
VDPALASYLRDLEPAAHERMIWPSAVEFEVTSYLTRREPPIALLTSVRAVVRRGDGVLVFDDERGESHVLPGGRLERHESIRGALERELAEETGCAVTNEPRLIGSLHFHRLSELPQDSPYFGSSSDFLQAVYHVTTFSDPIEPTDDPWVLRPRFVPMRDIDRVLLHAVERAFLID